MTRTGSGYAWLSLLLALGCGDDDAGGEQSRDGGLDAGAGNVLDAAGPRGVQITNVGAACTLTSNSCQGPGATCMIGLSGPQIDIPLPDGYCTASCDESAECGAGGGCPLGDLKRELMLGDISALVPLPSVCWDRCQAAEAEACRSGYMCRSMRDVVPPNVVSKIGVLLSKPSFTTTYCMPPIMLGGLFDGGLGQTDAGADAGT